MFVRGMASMSPASGRSCGASSDLPSLQVVSTVAIQTAVFVQRSGNHHLTGQLHEHYFLDFTLPTKRYLQHSRSRNGGAE